jgi:hypothetical protein
MDARDRFFLGWFLAGMGLNALAAGVFFMN